MSHGESFLALLGTERFRGPGLYLLDEPESALSFQGCLNLVAQLHALSRTGGAQMIVAIHSPLIAAVPDARIMELGPWGIRESAWADLALVQYWRSFLRDPQMFLRHLDGQADLGACDITSEISACRRRASAGSGEPGTTFSSITSLT